MARHLPTSLAREDDMSFHTVGIADSNDITADDFCNIYIWQTTPAPNGLTQEKIPNLIGRIVRKYKLNKWDADDLKMELHCKAAELVHERWQVAKWDDHQKEFLAPITTVGLMLSNIEKQLERTANECVTREFSHGMVKHNTNEDMKAWTEAQEYYQQHVGAMFVSRDHAATVDDEDGKTADSLNAIDNYISQNNPTDTPEQLIITKEEYTYMLMALQLALPHLSDTQRKVFELREGEGLSPDEVADLLGMSRSAVDANLSRAKKKLAELVKGDLSEKAQVKVKQPTFTVETRKKRKLVRKP